ncbi:MAG: hypothetical protein OXI23_17755, partial [Gemmatimonadota bacterium]|nr:hypothetical protein [Gemmatimonadota bacterium]
MSAIDRKPSTPMWCINKSNRIKRLIGIGRCVCQPILLHICLLLVCVGILALIPNVYAEDIPAFPGAEGYG